MSMFVLVLFVRVIVVMVMAVSVLMIAMFMSVVIMSVSKLHIHASSEYSSAGILRNYEAKFVLQIELSKFGLEDFRVYPQINHSGEVHVAADA